MFFKNAHEKLVKLFLFVFESPNSVMNGMGNYPVILNSAADVGKTSTVLD